MERVEKNVRETPTGRLWYIPARYVFAAVVALGLFLTILLRGALPISVTAMVRRNTSTTTTTIDPDSCPAGDVENDTTTPTIVGDFDWDGSSLSLVLSANAYGSLASSLVSARLAELWSPKHIFTICSILTTVAFVLIPVTAQWSVIAVVVLEVVNGFFSSPVQPVMMVMCTHWIPPEERQQLGAMILSVVSVGSIVSHVLTGNLVQTMGWRFVFYLYPFVTVVWIILWMVLVYDSPNKHPRISEQERIYITEKLNRDEHQAAARLPWKKMLLSVPMWAHIAMVLPSMWLSATLSSYLPTYLKNILHYSTAKIGNMTAIPPAATWFCTIFFGFSSQWVRRKMYLTHLHTYHVFNAIATLCPAILLITLTFVGCNEAAIITLLTLVTALSSAYIGGSQLNQMDIALNYSGTISGISSTLTGAVGILAPTITGLLTNNNQYTRISWNKVFYVAAGVNVVPFLVYLFFGSVEEQPWNRSTQEETGGAKRRNSAIDTEAQSETK